MQMLTIAVFELRARLRMISTWVYFVLYGAIAALWEAASGGAIEHAHVSVGSDKILINGPYPLAVGVTILGFMGVTVIAAMMGRAIQQDFEYGTFHFLFTAPIRKRDYFLGRFIGAYLALTLIFLGIAIGLQIGAHWPGVDPAKVAPFSAESLLLPYLYNLWPNMLWLGGVFLVIAALTRAMAPVYIAGVLVLIGYLLAVDLIGDMENKTLAALIDPMGTTALDAVTRYWSVAEKNTRQIPLTGLLLWNRLIWVGFGLLVTAAGYRAFRMSFAGPGASISSRAGSRKAQSKAQSGTPSETQAGTEPDALAFSIPSDSRASLSEPASHVRLDCRAGAYLRALPELVHLYLRETVKNPRFYLLVAGVAVFVIGSAKNLGGTYGTETWPLTYQVLEITSGFFSLFILIVTAINAGELVWRERDARMDEIIDSTPAPTWLGFFAKLITLYTIQALMLAVVMVCSIGIQLWQGYYHLEIGHYLFDLYALQWPRYWILGALALTVHVLVNQKYLGHFVVVVLFLVLLKLPDFGLEDRLYRFGSLPTVTYSALNGYGHFLAALRWFQLYWLAAAALLLVLANLMWVRGKDLDPRARLRVARQRIGRSSVWTAALAIVVMACAGSWIFYNTHVLNPFRSKYDTQRLQADYEKRYKSLEYVPQPKITAINVNADIYPHQHHAHLSGTLALVNRSEQPIVDLYVMLPSTARIDHLDFGGPSKLIDSDRDLFWWHYRLDTPLAPGATTVCNFAVDYQMHGFMNDGAEGVVVDNGTFLNGAIGPKSDFVPSFGYSEEGELELDRDRKKFGLAPKERAHDLDDARWHTQGFTRDADWVDYSATISTDADQLATTSGYLDKHWTQNGRAYFHYRMDSKMAAVYPFQSGRYAVRTDHWGEGAQAVAIEIDYQPGHEFDLDRMVAGVKDSLSYFTRNYGPYQHHILRIIEFPRYARFAESFPNTVPFSEAIGFVAKVDDKDPKDIDYPYFVTAHEVAHQWWGHQEMPAPVQGGEFISESLAEYSALMVLKHRYGDARMRRFLKYELDRYLIGRSRESKKEQPLFRADGPPYLHYQKGSLALYAMQDAIGEEALNHALGAFVSDWRFRGPPYPISRELLAKIRAVTPPDKQYLVADLFESIILFDNRATDASYRPLPNGRYEVNLTVMAKKSRSDGLGAETEVPMDEDVDIGVFDAAEAPLLLEKIRLKSGKSQLKLVVDAKPAKAGIDPLNKLIDRTPEDNTINVSAP
jgi:ABC-2 type transport system permease protein